MQVTSKMASPTGVSPPRPGRPWQTRQASRFSGPAKWHASLWILDLLCGLLVLGLLLSIRGIGVNPVSAGQLLRAQLPIHAVAALLVQGLIWQLVLLVLYLSIGPNLLTLKRELRLIGGASILGAAPLVVMGWREAALFSGAVFALLAVVHCSARLAALLWSRPPARNCIIVGSGPRAVAIDRFLMGSPLVQYRVFGFIDQHGTHAVPEDIRRKLLGTVSDLRRILKDEVIDEVFLALPVKSCYSQIQAAIHICEEAGIECKLPSDLFTCALAKLRFEDQDARSNLPCAWGGAATRALPRPPSTPLEPLRGSSSWVSRCWRSRPSSG